MNPLDLDDQTRRRHGLLITCAGVLILTPDSLLVRLIALDPWTLSFWRGVLVCVALLSFLLIRHRPIPLWQNMKAAGWMGWLVSVLYGLSSIQFVFALSLTTVANVLIIVATIPLWGALFSLFILKERLRLGTFIAILIAMAGILIVFVDGIDRQGAGLGELMALASAVTLGLNMTIARKARAHSMVPFTMVGAAFSAVWVLPLSQPLAVSMEQIPPLLLLCVLVLPLSFGLLAIAPRYLPSPEVGLFMLIETVLGPYWVWLAIGESPGIYGFVGGGIVIGVMTIHTLWRLKGKNQPA